MHGIKPWLQKQLQPLAEVLLRLHPEAATWLGLSASMAAAGLLYGAGDRPWLAVAAVPLLMARLALDALYENIARQQGGVRPASDLINQLGDRLSDVAIFLVFAFWQDVQVHLVLFALVSMLIVSYVGVLGQAAGAGRERGGLLAKPDRMVLLMVACLAYGLVPNWKVAGFNIFESMFILFIPLAAITLLQRLDAVLKTLSAGDRD